MRRTELPIIIGMGMRKGVCAGPSVTMQSGVDLMIVWLNRQIESGETFTADDVYKVNAVIHFCDRESVKRTIDVLTDVLLKWEGWQ